MYDSSLFIIDFRLFNDTFNEQGDILHVSKSYWSNGCLLLLNCPNWRCRRLKFNVESTVIDFTSGEVPEAITVALLNKHTISHTAPVANQPVARMAVPKLDHPKVYSGISLEEWNLFWKMMERALFRFWHRHAQWHYTTLSMHIWWFGRWPSQSGLGNYQ